MTATEILAEVISIITGGIVETAQSMGSGIAQAVQSIVFTTVGETQELSALFIIVLIFAGVALSLSLFRWTLNLITSFGNRNR